MTVEQDLILAAARVARAAPESWDEFMKKFHLYGWDLANKLVASPPEMVYIAQGRAQSVGGLGRLLEDCRKTANSIEENRKKE